MEPFFRAKVMRGGKGWGLNHGKLLNIRSPILSDLTSYVSFHESYDLKGSNKSARVANKFRVKVRVPTSKR